jgi:thymidylate kinase
VDDPSDTTPEMRYGRMIVLEGIDGAGKTALRDRLSASLSDLHVTPQNPKEIAAEPDFARQGMTSVAGLLWPKVDTSFDHLLPAEYWLYLQATWYTLGSRFVIDPKLQRGEVLLADGWYYKFYAKLRLRGFSSGFLDAVFQAVTEPALVLLLDPEVEAVWGRKQFRLTELGLHDDYERLGRDSFIDYQSRVRRMLLEVAARWGWPTFKVAPGTPIEETALSIEDAIRAHLADIDDPRPAGVMSD